MEWKEIKLESISESIQTGPFGSQLHQSDYSEVGTPVIMPKDMIGSILIEDSIARISENHVKRLKKHIVKKGDIIYSRRGDVGRCVIISQKEEGWICGTGCLKVSLDTNKVVPSFIFYILQRKDSIEWVENHAVGSTMLNLNTGILSKLPLTIPPFSIQQEIVSILSNYDTLIDINTKRIKILEETARELYKEWFVRMRFPGHEKTKFVKGIPEGWEYKKVTDLLDIKYGKDHKALEDGDYPCYGSGGIMRNVEKFLFEGESVLIPRKGSLNNIMIANGSFWTIDTMFYTIPKMKNVAKYAYYMLSSVDMESLNAGAALPSMTTNILSNMDILLPSHDVLEHFEEYLSPMFNGIDRLTKENQNLAATRDRLLPRLLSGELKVGA